MINRHWLELPMSRTIFYGPKDVRAIEVRLHILERHFRSDEEVEAAVEEGILYIKVDNRSRRSSYILESHQN